MKKRDVALDFGRAECVRAAAVFIEVSFSTTEHTLTQIGAPLFSVPILLAPFALRGELLVSPVPWTIDSLNHAGDMPRRIRGRLRGEAIDNMATNSPIRVGAGEGVGGDHEVGLSVVQPIPEGGDSHGDVSCLVGESAMSLQ